MFIVQISPVGSEDFTYLTPSIETHSFTLSYDIREENAAQFSAAVAMHTVPIFVPPGTRYCWVDRGCVDTKLAQGFYT